MVKTGRPMHHQNEIEDILQNLGAAVPKYCPHCRAELVWLGKHRYYWVMPYGQTTSTGDLRLVGFDVYCDECEWSGNIEPDVLDELRNEEFMLLKKEAD